MKSKFKITAILALLILTFTMLVGCINREEDNNDAPRERVVERERENGELPPLPERNPDGTLG